MPAGWHVSRAPQRARGAATKIFISADLEGISGVVAMEDVFPDKDGYAAACQAMTGDVNAAIEGARDAGADEIVVFDAHAGGRNLDLDRLHPDARVIRGQPLPYMIAGLDASFDALCLIGYHAMPGTPQAVMDHTYTGRFYRVRINGREFGELGLAAAFAGWHRVPLALVSGDDKLAAEARAFVPAAVAVVTKTGMGRHQAECLSPRVAQERIRAAAKQALAQLDTVQPLTLQPPLVLELEYPNTASADRAVCVPGVERTEARTVASTLDTVPDLVGLLSALGGLAV
jgi:D-amino peptidase